MNITPSVKPIIQIKWMGNRTEMVKRGALMYRAHWRGLIEGSDLDKWYERTLPQYARFDTYYFAQLVIDNQESVREKFMTDAANLAHSEHRIIFGERGEKWGYPS